MKQFFKKIIYKCYLLVAALFWGLKSADDEMLVQQDNGCDTEIGSEKEKHVGVAGALLRGEVTQQVKELRYRTYKVDRESKKFKYFSPTLALRKENLNIGTKFISYENSDNLDVVVIQPNDLYRSDLTKVESVIREGQTKDNAAEISGAKLDKPTNTIKIERDSTFIPRYYIEDFTKRVVVRRKNTERCVVDFYVSKYPDSTKYKSKGFISELKKLKEVPRKNDINEINKLYFVSYKAFGKDDLFEFEFARFQFIGIVEYDGMYILRYEATPIIDAKDLVMTEFYNPEMEKKYANKEKKDIVLRPFEIYEQKTYVCDDCGKEIKYDTEYMEELIPSQGRLADEDVETGNEAVEFMDAQIAKATYGKYLCKDCLKRHLEKLEEKNEH